MNDLTILSDKIIRLINNAKDNMFKKVNEELIMLYYNVGEYLSKESKSSSWGEGFIDDIAQNISINFPNLKGFNRRGLYRMKQFYETYCNNQFVSPLVTQISWTNHLLIMSACKSDEEREFYIKLSIKDKYSKRELARQLDSAYFERYMLSKTKAAPMAVSKQISNQFLDRYVLEFLDLPESFSERDLQKSIIKNLKNFVLEFGNDFTFMS